jgi:hypothetical protein
MRIKHIFINNSLIKGVIKMSSNETRFPDKFEIAPGTWVLDTSVSQPPVHIRSYPLEASAPEGFHDWPKRQTDYSWQLVQEAFRTGAIRIASTNEEDDDLSDADHP